MSKTHTVKAASEMQCFGLGFDLAEAANGMKNFAVALANDKILTLTTVTQSHDQFYQVWQNSRICPICTNQDDITWADLVADRVELCEKHRNAPATILDQAKREADLPQNEIEQAMPRELVKKFVIFDEDDAYTVEKPCFSYQSPRAHLPRKSK